MSLTRIQRSRLAAGAQAPQPERNEDAMQAHSKPARSSVRAALRAVVVACARTGRKPAPVALPVRTVTVRRKRNH